MKKKLVLFGCVILGLLLSGCGKKSTDELYDDYLKTVDDTYSYAKVDLGSDTKVLLIADVGTYDDGGKQVTIAANVYDNVDGKVTEIGEIECGGTAYPIRTDGTYLYESGNHFATRYMVDSKEHKLTVKDSVRVEYEEGTGDEHYYQTVDGKETVITEEEYNAYWDSWKNAESIAFDLVGVLK